MDLYSRIIALLKVLLPLAALAILSTLFLLSRNTTPTATIPFAQQDVERRIAGQQVTGPFFSGVTPGGDEVMITADRATPGAPGTPATADNLTARIKAPDGRVIHMRSDRGEVALDSDQITLDGQVHIHTEDGYDLTTDRLHASLSQLAGSTPGPVQGDTPMGQLQAGRMELRPQFENGPLHLHFNNGVKLIYDPQLPER